MSKKLTEKELVLEDVLKVTAMSHSNSPDYFFIYFTRDINCKVESIGQTLIETTGDGNASFFTYNRRTDEISNFDHAKNLLILATRFVGELSKEERLTLFENQSDIINLGILKFSTYDKYFSVEINNKSKEIFLYKIFLNIPLIIIGKENIMRAAFCSS